MDLADADADTGVAVAVAAKVFDVIPLLVGNYHGGYAIWEWRLTLGHWHERLLCWRRHIVVCGR